MKNYHEVGLVKLDDQNEKQHLKQAVDHEKVLFDDLTVLSNNQLEAEIFLNPRALTVVASHDLSSSF